MKSDETLRDELDFWRARAFKLAQALCSSNISHMPGTFGESWYKLGADTQRHYRAIQQPEWNIKREWNPEWEQLDDEDIRRINAVMFDDGST